MVQRIVKRLLVDSTNRSESTIKFNVYLTDTENKPDISLKRTDSKIIDVCLDENR